MPSKNIYKRCCTKKMYNGHSMYKKPDGKKIGEMPFIHSHVRLYALYHCTDFRCRPRPIDDRMVEGVDGATASGARTYARARPSPSGAAEPPAARLQASDRPDRPPAIARRQVYSKDIVHSGSTHSTIARERCRAMFSSRGFLFQILFARLFVRPFIDCTIEAIDVRCCFS